VSTASASGPTRGSQHCVTCGDDGIPMTVVRIDERRGLAVCAAQDGSRSSVETALVEPVSTGDRLLVHAGTAIASLEAADGP
jgi:hydrogenase assembly chaperone HypC/HupF